MTKELQAALRSEKLITAYPVLLEWGNRVAHLSAGSQNKFVEKVDGVSLLTPYAVNVLQRMTKAQLLQAYPVSRYANAESENGRIRSGHAIFALLRRMKSLNSSNHDTQVVHRRKPIK